MPLDPVTGLPMEVYDNPGYLENLRRQNYAQSNIIQPVQDNLGFTPLNKYDINLMPLTQEEKASGLNPISKQEEERAQNQSTVDRFENAGINLTTHLTSYLGQTAGQLLGVPMAIATGDISKITSNSIVEAFDNLKDWSDKTFPELATNEYKRAGIISKIFGAGRFQWWATEATDRAALGLAMLAPGMIESEGLGIARLVGEGLEATKLSKFEGLSDAFKFQKGWTASLTDKAISGLPEGSLKLANQLKSSAQILGGTISQSALSGYETEKAVKQYLTDARTRGENKLSDDEINKKAFDANQKTFWETVPASMMTSMVTLPQIFSNFQGIKHSVSDVIDEFGNSKVLQELTPVQKFLKNTGKAIGTGIESGPIAENLQVAISKANEDFYEGKSKTANFEDIITNWGKNFSDPENGQNNIALGFIQGIFESALGGYAHSRRIASGKEKSDFQSKRDLQDYIHSAILNYQHNDGTSFNIKEADGITDKIDPETGKPVLDKDKVVNTLIGMAGTLRNSDAKKIGALSDDKMAADWADQDALSGLAHSMLGLKGGYEHINNLLELTANKAKEVNGKNDIDEVGSEITPERILSEKKETLYKLRKAYNDVQNTKLDLGDTSNLTPEERNQAYHYIDNVRQALYNTKSTQMFIEKQKSRNDLEMADLQGSMNKDIPQVKQRIEDLQKANENLDELNKYHSTKYSQLLDPKTLQDEFQNYKELTEKINAKEEAKVAQEQTQAIKDTQQERVQETDQKLKNKQLTDIATKLYNKQELTPEEKKIYNENDEAIEMIHSDIQNAYAEHNAQQTYEQSPIEKNNVESYKTGDLVYDSKGNEYKVNSTDQFGNITNATGTLFGDKLTNKENVTKIEPKSTVIDNPFGKVFNPTPEELQEHTTQTTTGYIDPTYYDNTKDSNVDKVVDKLNDQLKDSQGSKSVDVNGNITIDASKIDNGYQALGSLSREYELVEKDNGKKTYKDIDNELIERMDKFILSTAKFNPGEEVELFVNEDYEGDFYDPSIKDDNKALLSWKSYLDSLKAKYGQNYKSSDEYIKNVPISINYKGETLKSTYYHQNSWINENKVAGNIEEDRQNNEDVRKYIVDNNSYKTKISSKGNGVLFKTVNKEYIPLVEATEDSNPIIAVVGKDQTFKVAKGKADASYFQDQTINVKDLQVGGPVLLAEVNQGKYMAIPLKNQQISKSKYATQVKESITKAIENYLDNNKGDKLTLDVLKSMKLDITSIEGMEKYITQFLNNYNTNKQDLQDLQKSGALPVNTNNTIFSINKGNIAIKQNGTVYYIGKNLQKKRELFFTQLDKTLDNLYLHTNIESLSTNENLILSGIDEPISYKTFMSETTLSNIKGFKVDEVNGKPIYSYTIQKVIRLDFGSILHKGEEEARVEMAKDEKDLPQPEENKEVKVNKPKLTINFQLDDFNELPALEKLEKINYTLKSVAILQSDKAKQVFDKGNKVGWDLNKILTELAIPKEQKQLLLDIGIKDRDQLVVELASKYSYSVEVNTAKTPAMGVAQQGEFDEDGHFIEYEPNEYFDEDSGGKPTTYYSNLTVPGGTNYTENEISTPLITPSIKGHAQFATDNGIGWFRSDEKTLPEGISNPSFNFETGQYNEVIDYNKIRRILEIQSDLFQKGRDKKDLISNNYKDDIDNKIKYQEEVVKSFIEENASKETINRESKLLEVYKNQKETQEKFAKISDNQFLQLLNKDNNWVTFFIKSIIQDSAKKGYEKVLFPKGETAAKVEGHQTIADELKRIDTLITKPLIILSFDEIKNKEKDLEKIEPFGLIGEQEIIYNAAKSIESYNDYVTTKTRLYENSKVELEQQKANLKSQSIEKLKPIEAFYEIKGGNILEKQFGKENVKTITDEYGNEWREIDLSNEKVKLETEDISLLPELSQEQEDVLQKASERLLVPGLNEAKQRAVVDTLVNSVITDVNEGKKVDTNKVYFEWQRNINENKENIKAWLDDENNKSSSNYTQYQRLYHSLDATTEGWKTITKFANEKYANIQNLKVSKDNTLDEQEVQSSERGDYNKNIVEKDPSEGLSSKVKSLLSGIQNIDKNGKAKLNWLGEPEMVDYREVYTVFQQWTTDLLRPNFDDMLTSIKSHEGEFTWVSNAITKLENLSDQDRKTFVNDLLNHYKNMMKVMFDEKDNKGGFVNNIQSPSKLSSVNTLTDIWKSNLVNSNMVTLHEGDYVFDTEKTKEISDSFKELQKNKNATIDQLKDYLDKFKITLPEKAWTALSKGYYRVGNKRLDIQGLLNNSYSPFVVLNNSITLLAKNRTLEDADILKQGAIKGLIRFAAKYTNNLYSAMVRTAGKTVYPFNKNTYVSNRFLDLTKGDLIERLKTLPFNKGAYWLQDKVKDVFKANLTLSIADMDSIKKHGDRRNGDNELHNLPESDYEMFKLGLIHASQEDQSGDNERIISLLYPTQSDKSTAIIAEGIPAFKIGYTQEGSIDEDTLTRVYNQLVLPEINRIIHFQKLVDAKKNINVSGLDRGWNKFYFIPSINTIEGVFVDGKLNTNIQADTTLIESIKEKLSVTITQLVNEKIEKWNDYGLIENGKPRYIDNRFIKEKIKGIDKENYEALNKALATDVVVQYLVGNANMFMTMIVDPANAYKSKSNDPIIQMKETFNNIGKRLAGDIAPGSETEANKSGTYRQAMIADRAVDSDNLKQLQDLLKEKAKDYTKEEVLSEGTNAQEFTTVAEQIARYYHEGVVAEDFYKSVIDTIHTEIGKNNHQYTSQIVSNLNKVNPEYGKIYSDMIFQVEKPVYVDNRIDNDLQHEIRHYIKTSAYALSPELTQGNDLDNIRIAMEKQGIDRLAFSSGIKLGNFSKPISLWDKEGKIKNPEDIDFTNSSVLLNRSGFRIQQIVPIEEEKTAINRVSQASKDLFLNLHDVNGFKYHGETYKGSDLDKIYQDNYRQIFDIQKNAFAEEIGYDLKNKRFVNTQQSIDKIKKLLLEEAISRNYSINETESIQLDNTLKLLAFSASSQRMESLLNSLIQNRVLKITQPGKSFVLSTEEGYQNKEVSQTEVKSKKGIVYTPNWTGKLLPQRIENGVVKPTQAIVPFKFRNNEGDLLHVEDFIDKETGLIDANKLPDELRQLFGMRIPNQGLNSQSWIEIVGFMPHNAGDVIVATRDYLVQMGSDFDVDKLYTYMYSTYYDSKSGKLKKFKATPKAKESLSETMEESKIPDEAKKKELLNNILDVHIAIHSNAKDEVQKQIFEPLGTWEFENISKRLTKTEKSKTDFVGISDQYQQNTRLNNATDKALVGIYSNLSMFNAVAQNKQLKMIAGYTKEEIIIPFILKFGTKKSNGDLSSETTLQDSKTYKSEVISGLQSCAVDGAKLQVLGKFNHNLQTAKYVNLLSQLGFKEEVALFTAQPIIKDLIKEVKNSQSIIKPYESDIVNKTIAKLKESIKKSIINFDSNLYEDKYSNGKGLSIENMWDNIEKSEEDLPDKKYIQLAVLEQFEYLTPYANTLSAVMSSINTDSKGLDKNLLETNIKYKNVLKNINNKNVNLLNVEKLLEDNINGAATDILEMSNNIWNNFLPYEKKGIQSYFNSVLGILGKQDLSITRKAELQKDIFDEFKSYIFSNQDLGLSDKDLYSERQRLFFGENSLANTISKLQEQEQWKNHAFIGKLYYELNKNGLPSITKINAAQEDIVEQTTLTGAYDMLINNKKIEGTEYTTRTLMQDLILGAYITGGIQQAQQYLKYIPQSYLHTIPFADKLSQMVDKFNNPEFMQMSTENSDAWELPSFIVQYFQHNSDKIKKIPTDKNGALQGIKKLESKNGLLEKFILTSKELKEENPIFLTTKAEKRKKGLSKTYLYINQGEEVDGNPVFTRIDTLGYSGFKEYNSNISKGEFAKSSIIDNNADNIINIKQSENEPQGFSRTFENPEMTKTPFERLEVKEGDKETIKNILNNIISEDTIDPYYKLVSQILVKNVDNFKDVTITSNAVKGAGTYENNTKVININPKAIKNQDLNGITKSIIHEVVHSQINPHLRNFEQGKTKGYTKEQLIALTRLNNVFTKYKETISGKEPDKLAEFNKAYQDYVLNDYESKKVLKTSAEDFSKFYPTKQLSEFVTMLIEDQGFQRILNDVTYDDNRTWLGKIFDEITNVLGKMLGITINKNSALEVALHDSMSLLDNTTTYNEVNTEVQEKQTSELPETMPTKKDILKRFNELTEDGHSKLIKVDSNGNTTNYHIMLRRAQTINKSQNLYKATIAETVGEAVGRNNKEKYYYISLTPREDISLLDRMQNISDKDVENRIKICR